MNKLEKEHIGLIGSTGFVGATLLRKLLVDDHSTQITLLTRNEKSKNFQDVLADHYEGIFRGIGIEEDTFRLFVWKKI